MQLGNVTTDPAKDYGIPVARQQYVAGLPDDHPHKGITDFDYVVLRIGTMIDSWAQQADQAAANPPASTPGGGVSADWRPQANTDLALVKTKLFGVLSSMQADYAARGQTSYVDAVLAVKDAVKVIQNDANVVAVYSDSAGTRAQFDAAVLAAWGAAAAPAPNQVKADFGVYGGSTVWG